MDFNECATTNVTKEAFIMNNKTIDERFMRDKERLNKMEDIQANLVKLCAQFAEIIKSHNEKNTNNCQSIAQLRDICIKLDIVIQNHDKEINNYGNRLDAIEREPKDKYNKIIGWAGAAIISALVTLAFKNM